MIDIKSLVSYDTETGYITRKSNGKVIGGVTAQGYLSAYVGGKPRLLHRLAFEIMEGRSPRSQIDHIDRVRTNNVWSNLREVSVSQNSFNRGPNRNRNVLYKNVYYIPKLKRYRVKMKIDGITRHFGYYNTEEAAAEKAREIQITEHNVYAPT